MGAKKHLETVQKYLSDSPVINSASLKRLIQSKKPGTQYQKQLIHNLVRKGVLRKLAQGCYTIHAEASLAVHCFTPAYLGLEDALSHHGMWEQETIPIIITARKVRQGMRKFEGTNYMVRRIDKKYYFGIDYYQIGEFYLPYSDKEKTFLDVLYFKLKFTDEELQEMVKGLDKKNLKEYLKNYSGRMKKRVENLIG